MLGAQRMKYLRLALFACLPLLAACGMNSGSSSTPTATSPTAATPAQTIETGTVAPGPDDVCAAQRRLVRTSDRLRITSISPSRVRQGDDVAVTVAAFPPNAPIVVYVGAPGTSRATSMTRGSTDAQGEATLRFVMPNALQYVQGASRQPCVAILVELRSSDGIATLLEYID